MLLALVERLGADRTRSWMIGDSSGDVQAGRAAGLRSGLVFAPNRCELCPLRAGVSGLVPDAVGARLDELASAIVAQQ
jgi:D-glycero-D-manno-heptose 1,7-bisphosphate phosphatase